MSPPPLTHVDNEAAMYLLKEFLEEQKRLREKGITLEKLFFTIEQLGARLSKYESENDSLSVRQLQTELRLERYAKSHRVLAKRVLPEEERNDMTDTGVHKLFDKQRAEEFIALKLRVEQQNKQLEEQANINKDENTWWKRQRWIWGIGALAAVFLLFLSTIATILVSRLLMHK